MSYYIYLPIKGYFPSDLFTTNHISDQVLQEFEALRYKKRAFSNKAVSSCIDQAIIYFRDAQNVNWRSSGLLYYYSFLNFTKAYIAVKKIIRSEELTTTSLMHGIKADPKQIIGDFLDYEISIKPQVNNSTKNIFSCFYEALYSTKWPFQSDVKVKIGEVIQYSGDISNESSSLFNVSPSLITVNSIIIDSGSSLSLQILFPSFYESRFPQPFSQIPMSMIPFQDLPQGEMREWAFSFPYINTNYSMFSVLRTQDYFYSENTKNKLLNSLRKLGEKNLSGNYVPITTKVENQSQWMYSPEVSIQNCKLKWHPFLSEYLISFALSSILRYQPQIVANDTKSSFLLRAWCNQSAITALRQLLMIFSNPPIRVLPI
jgi:hypothetical protein